MDAFFRRSASGPSCVGLYTCMQMRDDGGCGFFMEAEREREKLSYVVDAGGWGVEGLMTYLQRG